MSGGYNLLIVFIYHLPVIDCPHLKHLYKYVREKVCAAGKDKWRDLGIELMGEEAVYVLDIIKVNSPDNVECCIRMFTEWRQRTPKASWKQLIEALKEVKLTQLASELEKLLIPSKNPSIEKTRRIPRQSSLEELEGSYIVSCVCSFISQIRLHIHASLHIQ